MSGTDPPPKPTLYLNGTKDAHWAKGLLEKYAIDFEERQTSDPFVSLHWNGTTYTDLFGDRGLSDVRRETVAAGDENARPNRGRRAPWVADTPFVIRVLAPSDVRGCLEQRARGPSRSGKSHALREEGTMMTRPVDVSVEVATACRLVYWLVWRPEASTWCAASPAPSNRPHVAAP